MQQEGPIIITTDLNCNPNRLPALQYAIEYEGWVDVGGNGSMFNGIDGENTCRATPYASETRRDYIFANNKAVPLIESFKVDDDASLHTHKILTLQFKESKPVHEYNIVKLPERICKIVHDKCIKMYGDANIAKMQDKRNKANEMSKQFQVDFQGPVSPVLNRRLNKKTKVKRQPIIDYIAEVKSTENLSEHQQELDASSFSKSQLDEQKKDLHELIDSKINEHNNWQELLNKGNTEEYMQNFSRCIEDAAILYGEIPIGKEFKYLGRSTVNIKRTKDKYDNQYNTTTNEIEAKISVEAKRILLQHRRLISIKNFSAKASSNILKPTACDQCLQTINKFKQHALPRDEMNELIQHLEDNATSYKFNYFTLVKHADKILHDFKYVNDKMIYHHKNKSTEPLKGKKAHSHISKIIKGRQPAPMTNLKGNAVINANVFFNGTLV